MTDGFTAGLENNERFDRSKRTGRGKAEYPNAVDVGGASTASRPDAHFVELLDGPMIFRARGSLSE